MGPDQDRLRRVLEIIDGAERGGRMIKGLRQLVEGGLAGLDGQVSEAVARLSEAIDLWEQVAYRGDVVTAQAWTAYLLGTDHPVGREASEAVARWIDETGAERLRLVWAGIFGETNRAVAGA
jgi:hypothetical protein